MRRWPRRLTSVLSRPRGGSAVHRLLTLLWRAVCLRCPNCGGGKLFRHWFAIRDFCPTCGLWIEREEGFYTGAVALNLVASEVIFIVGLLGWILLTWPNPPWETIRIAAPVLVCAFPLAF